MTDHDAALIEDLARRLDRLRPSHRDPEAYFVERSEIAHEMRRLARTAERSSSRAGYAAAAVVRARFSGAG